MKVFFAVIAAIMALAIIGEDDPKARWSYITAFLASVASILIFHFA